MDIANSAEPKEEASVREQAAQWLSALPSSTLKQRRDFLAWLRKSPLHVREMLLTGAFDQVLDQIDPQRRIDLDKLRAQALLSNITTLDSGSLIANATRPSQSYRWSWAAAALVAVSLLTAVCFIFANRWSGAKGYETDVGEQRTIHLADGSLVYLDTHSKIRVGFSQDRRDLELLTGQAIFKVARDPNRPFRVRVGATSVQALSTQFDIYRRPNRRTTISVLEGAVQIDSNRPTSAGPFEVAKPSTAVSPNTPARVSAGETATVELNGQLTSRAPADVAQVTAWRDRRLIFRATPLQEIAQEFNRYNHLQLRVEGEDLKRMQFWGVFDADSPDSLIRSLADNAGSRASFHLDRRGNELIIQGRVTSP